MKSMSGPDCGQQLIHNLFKNRTSCPHDPSVNTWCHKLLVSVLFLPRRNTERQEWATSKRTRLWSLWGHRRVLPTAQPVPGRVKFGPGTKSSTFCVYFMFSLLWNVSAVNMLLLPSRSAWARHSAEQHGHIFLMSFWHRNLLTQNRGIFITVYFRFEFCVIFILFCFFLLKEKQEAGYNARKPTHSV